jgi:hypothetical protein
MLWLLAAGALAALRGPPDSPPNAAYEEKRGPGDSPSDPAYEKKDGASCSPRCDVQLDVVAVAESQHSAAVLGKLLPHFSFGPQRFALMDGPTQEVLAGFVASRPQYLESVRAWASSDKPPAAVDVLAEKAAKALLPSARAGAYTSLVILNDHTVSVGSLEGAPALVEVGPLSDVDVTKVVQQLLPQVCPGLKIDPSMPCGPSRWGKAVEQETNQTWGDGESNAGPPVELEIASRTWRMPPSPMLF